MNNFKYPYVLNPARHCVNMSLFVEAAGIC